MSNTDAMTVDLDSLPLQPNRCMHVLSLLLRQHNWQHAAKAKGVSHRTMQSRARLFIWVFRFLRSHPEKRYKLDPRSFSGRHAALVLDHWREQARASHLAPATLATYFSHLKTFTRWIGKPTLLPPIEECFGDPALHRRSLAATEEKSWRAIGVDVERVITDVEAYDVHAAACLKLMRAFGLRFKESLMLRPHLDVVTTVQAQASGTLVPDDRVGPGYEVTSYLDTHRGTKGGRRRFVPIGSDAQRDAIDYARQVTKGQQRSVSDPDLTLKQAMRRLRYVMERFGITRADLGVVPHGLRHGFAAAEYERISGSPPPVVRGSGADKATDLHARQAVAHFLGHGRPQICRAYLGQCAVARSIGTAAPPASVTAFKISAFDT